jgi:hypothetical protein
MDNFNFYIEPKITKDFLLSYNNEETYMSFYLGIPIKKGLFCSPLRKDNAPTCSFYRNKQGDLIFKDFNGSFYGNFISVVMYKYKIGYAEALKTIANDFNLVKTPGYTKHQGVIRDNPRFEAPETALIRVEVQDFLPKELEWWGSYGITEKILKKFHVYSCKNIFLNGSYFMASTVGCPAFGYYGGKEDNIELWRIYFPKKKQYRFLTNWKAKQVQGYKQLPKEGKLLVITKSMKDVMCLYSLGIKAIAPNSENLFISDKMLEELKTRFTYIAVLYDNDLPGISNMNKIKKSHPELVYTFIPRKYEAKDISDFRKIYGEKKTKQFIKDLILKYK